jgi:hypothetical protein
VEDAAHLALLRLRGADEQLLALVDGQDQRPTRLAAKPREELKRRQRGGGLADWVRDADPFQILRVDRSADQPVAGDGRQARVAVQLGGEQILKRLREGITVLGGGVEDAGLLGPQVRRADAQVVEEPE